MTRLKDVVDEKGLKVVWIAKRIGLSRQIVSEIMNGWASERTVRKWGPRIAEVVGEPVEVLFPELDLRREEARRQSKKLEAPNA